MAVSRPRRLPLPVVSFQDAMLALVEQHGDALETTEGWREVRMLILKHMHELNTHQSPRSTLGMVYDTLLAQRTIKASEGKGKVDAAALQSIFGEHLHFEEPRR